MAEFEYREKFKFPEPKTFRGATSPVTLIKWALGVGTLEYPTGHPRRVISLCWSGAHLILFLNCVRIASLESVWDLDTTSFTRTTYQTFILTCILYGTTFICLGQVNSKTVADRFSEIDRVNDTLKKFGIPEEYGSTFKSQIAHVAGGVVFILAATLFPVFKFFDEVPRSIIASCISGIYIIVVSFFEDFTFISCIRYIGKRFRHLNTYLDKLSNESTSQLSLIALGDRLRSRWAAEDKWMMHVLRDSRKIHRDLCNIARIVNEAFGIQILLSMAVAVAIITTILFNTYTLFAESATITSIAEIRILLDLFWIVFYGMRVFWIISACSMASSEAHRTGERMYQLVKPATSNEIREEIHAFSLQLIDKPLEFTAFGFFILDYAIIRAMVGTVTTYLVIIIQMPRTSNRPKGPIPNATIPAINAAI